MKSVRHAVAIVAFASAVSACGGSEKPVGAPPANGTAASSSTSTTAPKPVTSSTPSKTVIEQAFVLEVMGKTRNEAIEKVEEALKAVPSLGAALEALNLDADHRCR